jgi:hypothetical protein
MSVKIGFGSRMMSNKQTDEKRRQDRLFQQRHRGSKRSYVTEIENLRVLLAWEAEFLSEGQAAKRLGLERVELRDMRLRELERFADRAVTSISVKGGQ